MIRLSHFPNGEVTPTNLPTGTFDVWDITKVRFPDTNRPARTKPAVIYAASPRPLRSAMNWSNSALSRALRSRSR